jgi:response regulator NasT
VLIVCGRQEFGNEIAALMTGDGFLIAETALSVNEARRKLAYLDPDLIIVSLPLPDEPGLNFIYDLTERNEAVVIVLVKPETLSEMQYGIEQAGALILPKPVSKIILKQTVRFALNSRRSIKNLQTERAGLKKQIDERKTVETAKWLLIEHLKMTEPEAHRHIQKQAMDQRVPQLRVAQEIIKHYDNNKKEGDANED